MSNSNTPPMPIDPSRLPAGDPDPVLDVAAPSAGVAPEAPPPMAEAVKPYGEEDEEDPLKRMATSKFDVVSSWLMALLWFIGLAALFLFIIWLSHRVHFPAAPMELLVEEAAGRGENAEGFERDFEPPGAEEVEDLQEPTLQDTIQAVTEAVSTVAATLDSMNTSATTTTVGTGRGDSRPPGPMGEGEDLVPRSERWTLKFTAKNEKEYAKQLDNYNFELAVVGGGRKGVDIVNNLTGGGTSRQVTDDSYDKRLYFMHANANALRNFELSMIRKAGVQTSGRRSLKFIDPTVENYLANIEKTYASERNKVIKQVAKTVFESQPQSTGKYQFVVISQRYRK
ncbi:MAG: hypothetical protein AAFP90_05945 [Planctomycetota bacterium]